MNETNRTKETSAPFPSWEAWNRMRNGDLIPPVETDRALYEAQRQFAAAHITYTACVSCKQEFSDENCFTQAGWQETQISGMCERCFDAATMESEDDEERCPIADSWCAPVTMTNVRNAAD